MSDIHAPNQDSSEEDWEEDWEEDGHEQDDDSQQKERGDRQEERLVSHDPATLILTDGRAFQGRVTDMSLGGMLFMAEEPLPAIEQGEQLAICLELYGRALTFPCLMMHQQSNRAGLKRLRDPEGSDHPGPT